MRGAWLDHFVVGIDDLDAGSQAFEERTGVRPAFGGEHPAFGTHNALVSLGPARYLEILAPRPGAVPRSIAVGIERMQSLTPHLWAVATDDLAGAHRRVADAGFVVGDRTEGSRVTADGHTLRWSMFLLGEGRPDNAPFFLEWADGTPHPSTTSPEGCTLLDWTVASRDPAALARLLDAVGMEAHVVAAPADTVIRLDTPRGDVTLRG